MIHNVFANHLLLRNLIFSTHPLGSLITKLGKRFSKGAFCSVANIADMVADIVATDAVLSICSGLTCLYSVRQITIYNDVN